MKQQRIDLLARIASVHRVTNSVRVQTFQEIVLSTSLETLKDGPLTSDQVVDRVRRIWPGAMVQRSVIEYRLELAAEVELVRRTEARGGTVKWELLESAELELEQAEEWAKECIGRFRAQLAEKYREFSGTVLSKKKLPGFQNALLMGLYSGLLESVIVNSHEVFNPPRVDEPIALYPGVFDFDRVEREIRATLRHQSEEDVNFVLAVATAAVSPHEPFAEELVTTLVTGFAFHRLMARIDVQSDLDSLGAVGDIRILVDTNILIELLGENPIDGDLHELLRTVGSLGAEIVVVKTTIDEAMAVLDSMEKEVSTLGRSPVQLIEEELAAGSTESELLLRFQGNAVVSWLRRRLLGPDREVSWEQFRAEYRKMETYLASMNVDVVDAWGNLELSPDFESSLREKLAAHGRNARLRRPLSIAHDSVLMSSVWTRRSTIRREGIWPSCVILSTDRQLNDAYVGALSKEHPDTFPCALLPSQLLGILSLFAAPDGATRVARQIGGGFRVATFAERMSRIPPELYLDVVSALDSDLTAVSAGEILNLIEAATEQYPDLGDSESRNDTVRVAAEVLASRQSRLARAEARSRELREKEMRNLSESLEEEKSGRLAAEHKLNELRQLLASQAGDPAPNKIRRAVGLAVAAGSIGTLFIASAITLNWWATLALALALTVIVVQWRRFLLGKISLLAILLEIVLVVIGVLDLAT